MQKTAYEVRISDWSSDVCSSDLQAMMIQRQLQQYQNLLLNSTGLPMQEWGETMQAINSVNNVMRQSQSLSFQSSNLQQQLLNKFKGYGPYNSGSLSDADMQGTYRHWSDDTNSAIATTLEGLGLT